MPGAPCPGGCEALSPRLVTCSQGRLSWGLTVWLRAQGPSQLGAGLQRQAGAPPHMPGRLLDAVRSPRGVWVSLG